MKLEIDLHDRTPIYLQIVERIKHMVAVGALSPGDQLPTVRRLADDLGVNFNTVARAYALLNNDHVISTQQGRGTYVRQRTGEPTLSALRAERLSVLLDRAVVDALSLGYATDEVRKAFETAIKRLEKARKR